MRTRQVGLVVVGLVLAAQLVPVNRSNPPVTGVIPAPPEITAMLRRACWDCHSRETRWPWYARVAPASWLVAHDVAEAREHLDLTAWDGYRPRKRARLLGELAEEVEEGEMPLWYYVLLHGEARLAAEEADRLVAWAEGAARPTP